VRSTIEALRIAARAHEKRSAHRPHAAVPA
jgi:hypothetical protein